MAVLQAWEKKKTLAEEWGGEKPPSPQTHSLTYSSSPHPLPSCASVLPLLQSRMFFCVRSSAELSPSGAQQQQRREERKEGRKETGLFCSDQSFERLYLSDLARYEKRSMLSWWYSISPAINFNRTLRCIDVFVPYSGSFFKELTCLYWFDLRLSKIHNWELRGKRVFASAWNEDRI